MELVPGEMGLIADVKVEGGFDGVKVGSSGKEVLGAYGGPPGFGD